MVQKRSVMGTMLLSNILLASTLLAKEPTSFGLAKILCKNNKNKKDR